MWIVYLFQYCAYSTSNNKLKKICTIFIITYHDREEYKQEDGILTNNDIAVIQSE